MYKWPLNNNNTSQQMLQQFGGQSLRSKSFVVIKNSFVFVLVSESKNLKKKI